MKIVILSPDPKYKPIILRITRLTDKDQFNKYYDRNDKSLPTLLYQQVCRRGGCRWPEVEGIIAQDPEYAYYYANNVIRGPWPEAEETIMQDPEYAYSYAFGPLQRHRWSKAEPCIMLSPLWAVGYAKYIIKSRWPEAEPYIMKVAQSALYYALDVIHDRWPEAEPTIMQNPQYAEIYTARFHDRVPDPFCEYRGKEKK